MFIQAYIKYYSLHKLFSFPSHFETLLFPAPLWRCLYSVIHMIFGREFIVFPSARHIDNITFP